jgi:hypothetical protein
VQVLPLQIGKLGRKQSAIPFKVLLMPPHLGRFEVNHPPSPLWMFLSRFVEGPESSPRVPDSLDLPNHTFRKVYGKLIARCKHWGVEARFSGLSLIYRTATLVHRTR